MNSLSLTLKILGVAPVALSLLAAASAAEPGRIPFAAPADAHRISGAEEEMPRSGKPVGLRITLCLWSQERPAPLCRDVPLTPGAAGRGFDDKAACEAGKERALNDWFEQVQQVFGFNSGWAGDGYQIKAPRCVEAG